MTLLLQYPHFDRILLAPFNNQILSNLFNLWLIVFIASVVICFITSEITKNYSQVDKIWSVLPIIYSFITLINFPTSQRMYLMTTLVTLWGIRLSFNFYRKGGYSIIPWKGEQDYRWNVLRQHALLRKGIRFSIFNLLFISFYQLMLIMLFCTPLLLAAEYENVAMNNLDYIAAFFMSLFIVTETIADNQLYNFQQQKQKKEPETGEFTNSLAKGFMIDGFWKYVRHPNFISEQLIWVSFYFFGVAASGIWINWTMAGPILLILLFMGSTAFTESISLKKYPEYSAYKQSVPKYIPINLKQKRA